MKMFHFLKVEISKDFYTFLTILECNEGIVGNDFFTMKACKMIDQFGI